MSKELEALRKLKQLRNHLQADTLDKKILLEETFDSAINVLEKLANKANKYYSDERLEGK